MSENLAIGFGPVLNAYPDSIGENLGDCVSWLRESRAADAFGAFYILPSLYHFDLDRGFSVQDYNLNEELASESDLRHLDELGIGLILDFVLNHASAQSPQFLDVLANGDASPSLDFFIEWNRFWEGHGTMCDEGYIIPDHELIKDMFFRKPGLPLLMVDFPDGTRHPFWNTFYQAVEEADGKKRYLGQIDLNVKSPLVWGFYEKTLGKLSAYGAKVARLDAFAYTSKVIGKRNFLNEPETWEILQRLSDMARACHIALLPEIHAEYREGTHRVLAEKGYLIYDFFLPGLIIDALERKSALYLKQWIDEIVGGGYRTVNMLGCHDGIPLLDLRGLLPDGDIEVLIYVLKRRGGIVKDLHGEKNMYYQVNCTYTSALGADAKRLAFARAVQMFMPGIPQVWYLDLLAGENDYEAVHRGGEGAHKEINRTNLSLDEVKRRMSLPVVQEQLALMRLRKTHPAFSPDATVSSSCEGSSLTIIWENEGSRAELTADFATAKYSINTND